MLKREREEEGEREKEATVVSLFLKRSLRVSN